MTNGILEVLKESQGLSGGANVPSLVPLRDCYVSSCLYCFDPHVTVEAMRLIPEGFVCAQISRISHDAFRILNSHSCESLSAGSERLYQEKGLGCKKMEASLALGLIL